MLRDQLADAIKTAMRGQNKFRLSTLRLVSAAIKDFDIARRGLGNEIADDQQLYSVLTRMIKQREESAKIYEEGGRGELADKERQEINIIREFLPLQLNDEEISQAVAEAVASTQAETVRDVGKVMAHVKERYAGRLDFAKAGAAVRALLSDK